MKLSVIIPTHNPHRERLRRTLEGLNDQSLSKDLWEALLIDNASERPLASTDIPATALPNLRILHEVRLGLTHARRCGFIAASGEILVMVDDDNVLSPNYLSDVLRLFESHPTVGTLGGRSLPEFERQPEAWHEEFFSLLALRDLGDEPIISGDFRPTGASHNEFPLCAPIGAGMALRKKAVAPWLEDMKAATLSDRRGTDLSSGGDNDIVLTTLEHGWKAGYFPELSLTHLIPAGRLDPEYLARLNRGINKSWMQVLSRHDANPWPPIAAGTLMLRQIKAWFIYRAWSSPAARIRWQGACGHFAGRFPVSNN